MTADQPTTVMAIAALDGKTRTSVAHDAHARAMDKCGELAIAVRAAFAELSRAQELMQAIGSACNDTLAYPLNDAWDTFRVKQFTQKEQRGENP